MGWERICVVQLKPLTLGEQTALAIEVTLPKTNLLVITTELGYIMCGALDVALLNEKLADRKIVAGRAVGVRNIEELLTAPLESVTLAARELGITEGMSGREALLKMKKQVHQEKKA